jgi:NADPH:quinone reductase-like Zn-dependent oxidoreductase
VQAIVQDRYGSPADVLQLREIPEPEPRDDEVLVQVRAASLHPDVWHVVRGRPRILRLMGAGLLRPKPPAVPGIDLAGVVERTGGAVTRFHPGDEVYGECVRGHQWRNGGAFAELAAVPAGLLVRKPARLTFEEAAAVPTSGIIALQHVRDQGKVRPGQRVLINGAAGGVGVLAVEIALALGAHVTGVDAADRQDLLRSLGAEAIDYTQQDFTRTGPYDVVIDIPGNRPFAEVRRALAPDGRYLLIGHDRYDATRGAWLGSIPRVFMLIAMSPFVRQLPPPDFKPIDKAEAMEVLTGLIEEGKLRPIVDRVFTLHETPGAIRYLEEGRARGKVVIRIGG